jgi:hypothetical protein
LFCFSLMRSDGRERRRREAGPDSLAEDCFGAVFLAAIATAALTGLAGLPSFVELLGPT